MSVKKSFLCGLGQPGRIPRIAPPVRADDGHREGWRLTVKEALDEFVAAKERAARSRRYMCQLRLSVRSLAGLGVSIRAVTARDVERMLAGKLAPRTQRNRLLTVCIFFNFAVRRGCAPPALHSPAQVRAVLETGRRVDLNVMRALVVRYFAGLRGRRWRRGTWSRCSSRITASWRRRRRRGSSPASGRTRGRWS